MGGQPVLSVRGEATLEVEPEIAVVNVTVEARDKDRRAVLDRLAKRNHEVVERINGYGDAIEKLESQPSAVYPDIKNRRNERIGGYLGRVGVVVTVRDFTVLGELVTSLADGELVSVTGPWWYLRDDSPARREVRLAAAKEAMLRAREYAEAFGGRVTGLVEAADEGLLVRESERRTRAVMMGSAVPRGGQQEELDFEPVRQTVRAQVEARFTMTTPEFAP